MANGIATTPKQKVLRLPKVLKQVAKAPLKLPARVASVSTNSRLGGNGAGRVSAADVRKRSPLPGEEPLVTLRVQIVGCHDLIARDRSGTSDPFVVVSLGNKRFQTPVLKKTLNPSYDAKDATFNFPIFLSLADTISSLEIVVWDKDMLTKDYLGEVALSIEDWFPDGSYDFENENKLPLALNLISSRTKVNAQGTIHIRIGFVKAPTSHPMDSFDDIYTNIIQNKLNSAPTILSAPPTRGIGTVRYRKHTLEAVTGEDVSELEDDGLSSDTEFEESDNEPAPPPAPSAVRSGTDSQSLSTPEPTKLVPPRSPSLFPRLLSSTSIKSGKKEKEKEGSTDSTVISGSESSSGAGTPGGAAGTDVKTAKPATPSRTSTNDTAATSSGKKIKAPKFKQRSKGNKGYELSADSDIVGIVMLEIAGAEDLPKIKNMTRLVWDMDPFVVISFGKKVFRTRVIRHSLNPQWEEKLLFHVRRYETSYDVQFAVLDWDKLSGNDHVGEVSIPLAEISADAPRPDSATGLYAEGDEQQEKMKSFTLPLTTQKDKSWEARHSPTITFRAKYQPYDALRQRFWRQYLKQYDLDETGTYSLIEIRSMLDSLGSTLTRATINNFFTRYGKNDEKDDLTVDEAVHCLELEITRPRSEKNLVSADDVPAVATGTMTPNITFSDFPAVDHTQGAVEYAGPDAPSEATGTAEQCAPEHQRESKQTALPGQGTNTFGGYIPPPEHNSGESSDLDNDLSEDQNSGGPAVERVVNIKTCPLCHRPRLNSKAEVDIITHLGVCASSDWNRVDRIVVGNYVTASQAQRKWYTKVITKVSSGTYQLGANSANIIVQNRLTGQLEEEKMQVYVRLGIRLLYKGASSRMEGARARRLLRSMSIKQGLKYDSPDSAREIPAFIAFHNLNVDEIRDPIDSFKNFNDFFYRKLKEDARPVASPNDPTVLVSGADCRMMAFESVGEATKLWIKGRDFTIAKLLGPQYADEVLKYAGGSLCIFRLAPQDYHRFHSPVDGVIGPMTYISGEYYTVNPQAIRTTLDVYGDNARKVVPIDSPAFGRVYAVCVGAMMVGSIITTVQEGQRVSRGEEFGYFAFGGSTIVMLFEKGAVQWDEDLLLNGRACLETRVRVGMQLGRAQ
ncbi:phosphatidylserine decarboxylase-domain-containing protein [Cantharellus anzutake]|uniref:phosphatidylserine decarboxylase-domain-containing protein n=1 Tax=Cantharellus anzutake TaxID=1750568 RepID=UPI001906A3FF|nr:phosphatidylserine decarboxylase-domain-containing protein [Cantharellus anzutake]KAF8339845.1 phosphatidylserine decarboxylase-domain-containing protein [Cantharellus anzutake]